MLKINNIKIEVNTNNGLYGTFVSIRATTRDIWVD